MRGRNVTDGPEDRRSTAFTECSTASAGCRADGIHVAGAAQNNLTGFDLDIPFESLTVLSGVSGSGKSSLAFDTLYAEGQKRYVETFSPYIRQFFERLPPPQADRIENIPAAVAIQPSAGIKGSRSTVGTLTAINDYLKLFFAKAGDPWCPRCNVPIHTETTEEIARFLETVQGMVMVLAPVPLGGFDEPGIVLQALRAQGFARFFHNGKVDRLEKLKAADLKGGFLRVVIDRLKLPGANRARLLESLEAALKLGERTVELFLPGGGISSFTQIPVCGRCGWKLPQVTPGFFSFNSPLGACPECRGFGRVMDVDPLKVIPDPTLSIKKGAVKPFATKRGRSWKRRLLEFCGAQNIPVDVPYGELSDAEKRLVMDGGPGFGGVRGFFKRLERKKYKMHVRIFIARYRGYELCPVCSGSRLRPESFAWRVAGRTIAEVWSMPVETLFSFFESLGSDARFAASDPTVGLLRTEILSRLRYLCEVGLGYLTLSRQSRTLSGGELERVNLTTALGTRLVGALFVLDEPSIGLHPRDGERLLGILKKIRDQGNTVVVVEHDPLILRNADKLIDLGPGAGTDGGSVVAAGHPAEVITSRESKTAAFFSGRRRIPVPERRSLRGRPRITITGASCHNLKDIDCAVPLDVFTCVTGPSGAGKSTLFEDILWRTWKVRTGDPQGTPGECRAVSGLEHVEEIVLVDQAPPGRSTRANPATYLGILDPIRKAFAKTRKAKELGCTAGSFSFNSPAGRCPLCGGEGFERVEMQFLPDVFVPCEDCEGRRYRGEVLQVRYCGHTISEVLDMTIREAAQIFADEKAFRTVARVIDDVGLSYLRLGQPLTTLSGGEAQRLKLLRHLLSAKKKDVMKRSVFILDEPSIGLHLADIQALLTLLQRIVDEGNTVCVIEHNMEIVKCADYCIDLGPGGGWEGGALIAAGRPEEVAENDISPTAPFLKEALRGEAFTIETEPREGGKVRSRARQEQREENSRAISITGAREHNLKNLTVQIPRDSFVVVTGLSGAGKSTLLYDVVFSEGQRRYLDCLSPYARQFAENLKRPDVDHIEGIPPTVAIEQRTSAGGARSTVGTVTEIYPFLRLLFARVGVQYCPGCGVEVKPMGEEAIYKSVQAHARKGGRLLVPKVRGRKGYHRNVIMQGLREGFEWMRINGRIVELDPDLQLSRYNTYDIDLVACRFTGQLPRNLRKKVGRALELGGGVVIFLTEDGKELILNRERSCPVCQKGFEAPEPRNFSFRSKWGMCSDCEGEGEIDGDVCDSCEGTRLKQVWRNVRIGGWGIGELALLEVDRLAEVLPQLSVSKRQMPVVSPILKEVTERIAFLQEVGLGYLTLHRYVPTLSTGEARRIRLASQLGSNLNGVCYILDEPTIGLHPRDNDRLLASLRTLRGRGNSILVVEHDDATIKAADHLIELGPGPGRMGGEVVFTGSPADALKDGASATGRYLARGGGTLSGTEPSEENGVIEVRGASAHNLKDVTALFPKGSLIAVTGVSGAGKSSLVEDVMMEGVRSHLECGDAAGPFESMTGMEEVQRVLAVDQSPIGRTPKSVPATYVGFWSSIRDIFANLPDAKMRGFTRRNFSFNTTDGACGRCKGQGRVKIEMSFLPDVYVECEACGGKRFKPEILLVKLGGKSIGDVLEMDVEEAARFFISYAKIAKPLRFLEDIGLGYLQLGQASTTLSGGEAQRIKLARELAIDGRGRSFMVLDEPTTGLHMEDVDRLLGILKRLKNRGDTVCVIEHNLEVIAACDWCIDLGPEGGDDGGRILYQGPVKGLLDHTEESCTARYLREYLK